MKNNFAAWIVAAVAAQATVILYIENSILRRENSICRETGDLLRDQMSELNSTVSRLTSERDYVSTRSFVLGATQAIAQPERFGEIWHDGYNRGLGQVSYASEHLDKD
jgi:hypothetical protein